MTKLIAKLHAHAARFDADKKGVTALEYGLIAGLIAVVIITAVTTVGTDIRRVFDSIAAALPST